MASLGNLSPELHRQILLYGTQPFRWALSMTDRYFHALIGPVILSKAETWDLRMQQEKSDPGRYRRACSKCFRFLQFYHFSRNQASARTKPEKRLCLDCFAKIDNPKSGIKWFCGDIEQCPVCRRLICDADVPLSGVSEGYRCRPCLRFRARLPPTNTTTDDGTVQYVKFFRDWLDRLDVKLPPRHLLFLRPDSLRLDEQVSTMLARLEDLGPSHFERLSSR
ncbi:hypothetical protein BZA05DRAFT_442603 [Tricharina praecox]|uniref:uncharacterized protein n=1 Tax=Tricharina praecox TaxID=43433 RepID=UPI00221FCB9E|nr:uncharacterized protein BZA05DRAFT_442603 [Tricharina praecox]KAI5855931.1 hypothetical protein BZA05DRAFT_442603 [Tricharina praecox]